jgi:hypothetical protein
MSSSSKRPLYASVRMSTPSGTSCRARESEMGTTASVTLSTPVTLEGYVEAMGLGWSRDVHERSGVAVAVGAGEDDEAMAAAATVAARSPRPAAMVVSGKRWRVGCCCGIAWGGFVDGGCEGGCFSWSGKGDVWVVVGKADEEVADMAGAGGGVYMCPRALVLNPGSS